MRKNLSQLHDCSIKHRKAILEELKKGKGISEEALKRILGDITLRPALDPRSALITIAYNASRLDMSMAEAMKEAEYQQVNQVLQFMDTMMLSGMKGMMEHRSNPLPSYENLNPDVRLDLAEMKAWDGFKNYDYIPISPESLAKTHGEAISSLNAGSVEGGGGTKFNEAIVNKTHTWIEFKQVDNMVFTSMIHADKPVGTTAIEFSSMPNTVYLDWKEQETSYIQIKEEVLGKTKEYYKKLCELNPLLDGISKSFGNFIFSNNKINFIRTKR